MTVSTTGRKIKVLLGLSLLCAAALDSRPALARDFEVKPTVTLSEEYNDNVEESAAHAKTDLITKVVPGLALSYLGANSSWNAAYSLEYINYARGTRSDEWNHRALVNGSGALAGNFLYLDASDTLSRVSLNAARDVTADSVFVNQVDQNQATLSPYFLWRYADKGSLRTGYTYTDVRYWNAAATGAIDRHQQDASAELSHEVLSKLSLTAKYTFSSVKSSADGYDSHNASVGARYQYAEAGSIFGSFGNSWQTFEGGARASNLFWDAGLTQDFRVLAVTLESRSAINTSPGSLANKAVPLSPSTKVDPLSISTKVTTHSAKLDRKFDRGAIGVSGSYAHFIDTQTGGSDRTTYTLGASGSAELRPSLTATLSASGDKVKGLAPGDYPYHFTGVGALSYAFNHELTAGLSYTHVIYRFQPDQSTGSVDVNRVVLDLKKVF